MLAEPVQQQDIVVPKSSQNGRRWWSLGGHLGRSDSDGHGEHLAQPGQMILDDRQLGDLRKLRAVVLDFQRVLASLQSGRRNLMVEAPYIVRQTQSMGQQLRVILDDRRLTCSENADSIQHMDNLWVEMTSNPILVDPNEAAKLPADQQLGHLTALQDQCGQVVFQIGVLTIPSRLSGWLDRARPGYYIPFHLVFADELPVHEDRVRILRYLAWCPKLFRNGYVDASTGLIYRHSKHAALCLLSVLWACLALGAATGLVWLSTQVQVPDWPIQAADRARLLGAWAALLAGVLIHVASDTAKRAQLQTELPPVLAMGDVPRVANAKLGQVLLKVLLALVGLFGLAFTVGLEQLTPLQAFFAGYTLDSVVGLFDASIEQRATNQLASLKQQLGVAGGSGG